MIKPFKTLKAADSTKADKTMNETPHNTFSGITLNEVPSNTDWPASHSPPPCSEATSVQSATTASTADLKNAVVVVTRAVRFMASHVVRALLCQGYTVRGTIDSRADVDDISAMFDIAPHSHRHLFFHELDIFRRNNWTELMQGAQYLVHVVMPLPSKDPKTEDDFIMPAVEGTRNVLAAATETRSIQRVVLITSIASIAWSKEKANNNQPYNEKDWEEEKNLRGFGKSQLLSEKLAWEIFSGLPESNRFEIVVLNPAYIFGPMLQGRSCSSMAILKRLLEDRSLVIPHVNIPIVDVRDVARAAVKSLVSQAAVGHRHILYSRSVWLREIASLLAAEFSVQGYKISQRERVPGSTCISFQRTHRDLEKYKPFEDNVFLFSNSRMRHVLEIEPRDMEETIVETAYSLIYWGLIQKPSIATLCGKLELD